MYICRPLVSRTYSRRCTLQYIHTYLLYSTLVCMYLSMYLFFYGACGVCGVQCVCSLAHCKVCGDVISITFMMHAESCYAYIYISHIYMSIPY